MFCVFVLTMLFIITPFSNANTHKACSIQNDRVVRYSGKCITLLGGSKACKAGEYLLPLECNERNNDEICHIDITESVILIGKCIPFRGTNMCQVGNDDLTLLGFDDTCQED